jgi:hypothetical protein
MSARVVRLAQGLERIALAHAAQAQWQREELARTEQQIAASWSREVAQRNALKHLYAGPLKLDRASLFELRRCGAVLKRECAELRAGIAVLQDDAARIRAALDTELAAVAALRRRQSRLLDWAQTDLRSRRKKLEQRLQNEQEDGAWLARVS